MAENDQQPENSKKARLGKALKANLQRRKQLARQLDAREEAGKDGLARRNSALAPRLAKPTDGEK